LSDSRVFDSREFQSWKDRGRKVFLESVDASGNISQIEITPEFVFMEDD